MSYKSSKTIVALIPARSGSVRIKNKNLTSLNGHPLIVYTIAAAKQSGIFADIVVSTDSGEIGEVARSYGAYQLIRPPEFATAESPDIEWVHHALRIAGFGYGRDYFAILRPTSPFRTAATIQRAWAELERSTCDSLRAVQPAGVNPYKLWWMRDCELSPILPTYDVPPWHSRPTQTLPPAYEQNASLEMAKCSLVRDRLYPSITGPRVWGFLNPPPEGFDINVEDDLAFAKMKIARGEWELPAL